MHEQMHTCAFHILISFWKILCLALYIFLAGTNPVHWKKDDSYNEIFISLGY